MKSMLRSSAFTKNVADLLLHRDGRGGLAFWVPTSFATPA